MIALPQTLRVAVGGVRSDNVANPTKRATASDPETGGDDEPKNAAQERAIVELANSRDEEREHRGDTGITWLSIRHEVASPELVCTNVTMLRGARNGRSR